MLNIHIDDKTFITSDGLHHQVIKDFHLELVPKQFTTLFGPSGCGKSTTLRIIAGLDRDYSGKIAPDVSRVNFAVVFQEPTLLPWRTVEDNIRICSPQSLSAKDLSSILDRLEIGHTRALYPRELSLGMARRVALARAFANQPDVLLLDEPFVSLDEEMAMRMRKYLKSLVNTYRPTVLMVSHNRDEAAYLSDSIISLEANPMRIVNTQSITAEPCI